MDTVFWVVVLGAIVAGFVQGLSGFAFGLVAMTIWTWALEPALASTLAVFGALTGQIVAAVTVRRGFDMNRLWPFLAGGLLGVPLGVWLLPLLDMNWLKAILGTLLVLWCPAMLFSGHLPKLKVGGRKADGAIGVVGGVMGGIGGFAGAVPTLWCTLRGYPKDEQRSVIQNFNLSVLAFSMLAHLAVGTVTTDMLPYFLVVAPAVLLPAILGSRVYIGISEMSFRRIVLSLLTVSGAALLASSVPALV